MEIFKSSHFDAFRCIAGACPDSCCKEWAVQVDEESAEYYRNLPGALGDRLRQVLVEEDGDTILQIEDGRCPMWRPDGLCRIQAELGEAALCKTCREFPRLTHDYGDFQERTLELSCPEAARLILNTPPAPLTRQDAPGGEAPEYDEEAMEVLRRTRETMLEILSDTTRPVPESLALGLLYGYQAQGELDGDEPRPFEPAEALESVREFVKPADSAALRAFFLGLELLTPEWPEMLQNPAPAESWQDGFRSLAWYFVERYWLQAVADYDLYSRVKFATVSCILVHSLGGDFVRTAQLYSKEIENNAENVDSILDAAYGHPAFTDDKILGMLLNA